MTDLENVVGKKIIKLLEIRFNFWNQKLANFNTVDDDNYELFINTFKDFDIHGNNNNFNKLWKLERVIKEKMEEYFEKKLKDSTGHDLNYFKNNGYEGCLKEIYKSEKLEEKYLLYQELLKKMSDLNNLVEYRNKDVLWFLAFSSFDFSRLETEFEKALVQKEKADANPLNKKMNDDAVEAAKLAIDNEICSICLLDNDTNLTVPKSCQHIFHREW